MSEKTVESVVCDICGRETNEFWRTLHERVADGWWSVATSAKKRGRKSIDICPGCATEMIHPTVRNRAVELLVKSLPEI